MHIYFSGIGGVGIGPLAMLALDAGYDVSGSDAHESEMTNTLSERGVKVYVGSDDTHIKTVFEGQKIDWFVYTSALPDDHPELVFAKEKGIQISKRGDFLNELLEKLKLRMVAVSGTHGKTTTTAMIVWLFKQLGEPVSYSIGTSIPFGPAAQYEKGSEFFVYEADEFDKNMLQFKPTLSVIPSLEYDHPDTYPTETDYLAAFVQFANQSKLTVTWDKIAQKLFTAHHVFAVPEDREFSKIKLAGQHTRENAWLAATAVSRLGLSVDTVEAFDGLLKKVSAFPGTSRRFEKLADNLYTDYAHHPSEIKATIQMAKELNKDVVVVYQPHQNVRQHELYEEGAYADCFDEAKTVYWLPTYLSREDEKLETLSPEQLSSSVSGTDVKIAEMNDDLVAKIKKHQEACDLVVCMSAGDLDAWLRENF